jgi:hypothetical protein
MLFGPTTGAARPLPSPMVEFVSGIPDAADIVHPAGESAAGAGLAWAVSFNPFPYLDAIGGERDTHGG